MEPVPWAFTFNTNHVAPGIRRASVSREICSDYLQLYKQSTHSRVHTFNTVSTICIYRATENAEDNFHLFLKTWGHP